MINTRMAEACQSKPFSNGTEGDAWMGVWCDYCTHDHPITHNDPAATGGGCQIMLLAVAQSDDEWRWPEAWLPEPFGEFALPSRMICHQFQPCEQGDCSGDPHSEVRASIVAEVTDYWRSQ